MNDEEFEFVVRRALRDEAYRHPVALRSEVVRARVANEEGQRRSRLWAAVSAAAAVGLIAVIVVARPLVVQPAGSGTSAASAVCEVSAVTRHGTWWDEIGGPNAFIQARSSDRFDASPFDYLLHVRFEPDAAPGETVGMWAERVGSGERVHGTLNSEVDPANLFRLSQRAPELPGGWYLFEQRFPVDGCWRLSAAIDGRVVGSAVVRVGVGTATSLPIGTHMTTTEVAGLPCFTFEVVRHAYDQPTAVRTSWWDQGVSGDCETRGADVMRSTGSIVPREDAGYDLVLDVPVPGQDAREIRVALYPAGDAPILAGIILSHDDASVFFTPDPAPRSMFTPDVER